MARTFEDVMREGINRALFVEKMEQLAPRRKPKRHNQPTTGTLSAIRNKRLALREGGQRRVQVVITYTKITTGETDKWIVCPYEIKFRKLKIGLRKMLYAWDTEEQKIKSFVVNNIKNVHLTDRKFIPKWKIQL